MDCRQSKRNDAPAHDPDQWPADFSRSNRGGTFASHGRRKDRRDRSRNFAGTDEEVIDLAGNFLAPGFIDLHVHGAVGRDTMEGTAEAFRAICDYHAGGGTTSLLLTTVTAPIDRDRARRGGKSRPRAERCRSCAARMSKVHLSRSKKPGRSGRNSSSSRIRSSLGQLLEPGTLIQRVTLAPELPGALDLIARLTNGGMASSGGHSMAWEEEARAGFERGMRQVTHTFNCMSSMRRRAGERVAGLLEFAMSEPEIFCELIADGHHVGTTLMRMLYRAKSATGICLVTDASRRGGFA